MSETLNQQGKALENQFFQQVDQKLLAQLREDLDRVPRREQLATVTNIKNPAVLDKLLDLGIDLGTYSAITYVPLAAVAWADATIDEAERKAVLEAAVHHGVKPHGLGYQLLERWLERPPGPELLQTWKTYIQELKKNVEPTWFAALRTEILDLAESVAASSGGILGLIQTVSPAEKRKLEELEKAFDS